jgi:hypothetical protein
MTTLAEPLPALAADGRFRRTLRVADEIDTARRAGCQVILSGPAAHDLFVDELGRALFLPDLLRSYCTGRGLGLATYRMETGPVSQPTLAHGAAVRISSRAGDDEHPTQSIQRLLTDLRSAGTPSVLFVDYADLVLPTEGGRDLATSLLVETFQALPADVAGWQRAGLQLVLCDRGGGLADRLTGQAGFVTVALDPPDVTETQIYLTRKTAPGTKQQLHLAADLDVSRASRLSGGLLLRNLSDTASETTPDRPLTSQALSTRKGDAIRQQSQNTLDLMDDPISFGTEVAGMPGLRLFLRDHTGWGSSDLRMTLTGPPGTGKTHSARAIAGLLGVPLVTFGQILGELLGQAENRMRLAISILRAMAPVMLFMDEADQGPLGSAASSGQTGNEAHLALRAMLFELFGDPGNGSGIHAILTTNLPNRLDPRTLSRFSAMPVFFATGAELGNILTMQARGAHIPLAEDLTPLMTDIVDRGGVLSGRSAKSLLEQSWTLARRRSDDAVRTDHVQEALHGWTGDDWTPAAEYSTLASLAMVEHLDRLPWEAARILGEREDVPGVLRTFLKDDGRPNTTAIHDRLNHLEARGAW